MDFAFFGAGDASYYESASLVVVFAQPPTPAQKKQIVTGMPAPLEPARWTKRTLHVATDEHAFAGNVNVTAFNAAIEVWLRAAHAISPIDFVLRAEDSESSTTFSQWHHESMAISVDLLSNFTKRYDDAESRSWARSTLLDMMRGAGIDIPPKLEPRPAWRVALEAGDGEAFAPLMARNDTELQLALDPTNEKHRRAVLDGRPRLDKPRKIDRLILKIAIYDDSPSGQYAIDQLLARAARNPSFATLCASTACQCIEDGSAYVAAGFAVLDRLVELDDAHPVVIETALFAVEHVGVANVDRARIDRYCTLARARLAEWKQLRPYLQRLGH